MRRHVFAKIHSDHEPIDIYSGISLPPSWLLFLASSFMQDVWFANPFGLHRNALGLLEKEPCIPQHFKCQHSSEPWLPEIILQTA